MADQQKANGFRVTVKGACGWEEVASSDSFTSCWNYVRTNCRTGAARIEGGGIRYTFIGGVSYRQESL